MLDEETLRCLVGTLRALSKVNDHMQALQPEATHESVVRLLAALEDAHVVVDHIETLAEALADIVGDPGLVQAVQCAVYVPEDDAEMN